MIRCAQFSPSPCLSRPCRASSASISRAGTSIPCHAPEVECIGKGKAHRPYEYGVKVSFATMPHLSKGGQFIAHVKATPSNPYDGHTLATILAEIEAPIGAPLTRIVADRGYRGHNAPPDMRLKIYISSENRGVTDAIKHELRRR